MGEVQKTRITSYIPDHIAEALKKKAEDEYRTVSNLAASILVKYVEENLLNNKDD